MELDELRQMSVADLAVKERETREEVFRLRLKLRTNQLDKRSSYRHARRDLAWILTVIREKSASASAPGAGSGDAPDSQKA